MDDPYAGGDRPHRTWRDLPPSPPVEWPAAARQPPRTPRLRSCLAPRRAGVARPGVSSLSGCSSGSSPSSAPACSPPDRASTSSSPLRRSTAVLRRTALRATSRSPTPSRGSCPRSSRSRRATSSVGLVAAKKGLILTASHVVGRAQSVTLKLSDGSEIKGTVAAVDKTIDTAVVRPSARNLVPLQLGALADVKVGQTAIAIGNPFGLGQTVTTGIVSATDGPFRRPRRRTTTSSRPTPRSTPATAAGRSSTARARSIGINTAIPAPAAAAASASPSRSTRRRRCSTRSATAPGQQRTTTRPTTRLRSVGFRTSSDRASATCSARTARSATCSATLRSRPGPGLDELGPLLDDLFRALGPEFSAPAPDPSPEPDATPTPAPDAQADPGLGRDILDQLMRSLLDQLLDPSSGSDPFGTTPSGAQGAHP